MTQREFPIAVGGRPVPVRLLSPDRPASHPALLLMLQGARAGCLQPPYELAVQAMLAAGHHVASYDQACHGDDARPGWPEGLVGMAQAIAAGEDPFARDIAVGQAVMDAGLAEGWATPGRIGLLGISRGGYSGLRLMAADPRIAAAAAMAPVTDWRIVRPHLDAALAHPLVTEHTLHAYAPAFAGRPLLVVISADDDRVSTARCTEFMAAIYRAEAERPPPRRHACYHVEDLTIGHCIAPDWHRRAAEFILRHLPAEA